MGIETKLSNSISIIPFKVPHRDEFSETVGYKIIVLKRLFYLYQILTNGENGIKIIDEINDVDMALLMEHFMMKRNKLQGYSKYRTHLLLKLCIYLETKNH